MYISVPALDGKFLSSLTIDTVGNYFSLPLERDEELSPGIYISKPVRVTLRFLRLLRSCSLPNLNRLPYCVNIESRVRSSRWPRCCGRC